MEKKGNTHYDQKNCVKERSRNREIVLHARLTCVKKSGFLFIFFFWLPRGVFCNERSTSRSLAVVVWAQREVCFSNVHSFFVVEIRLKTFAVLISLLTELGSLSRPGGMESAPARPQGPMP